MARRPTPWLRKGRGWYVQLGGKQVFLSSDKDEAFSRYHALMLNGPTSQASTESFLAVCDQFLDWTKQHRAPRTYAWYVERLSSFAAFVRTRAGDLKIDAVKPLHVRGWLEAHPTWASTTQRQSIVAVQRCFNWAERMGYVDRSPVRSLEKPRAKSREAILAPSEFAALLEATPDQAFRDLLIVSWETGCRPQESLRVEARHVDLAHARWVFPPAEAKGGRRPRIIYLSEPALAITRRRISEQPQGPLFRNTNGEPWTPYAVNCRFQRHKQRLGIGACLYMFRHTFATRMLESGLDALTVALLLGHSNPAMLSTTYQHLAHNPAHLLGQLRKASC